MVAQLRFNHDLLRTTLRRLRKSRKLTIPLAAEQCNLDPARFTTLERGWVKNRQRPVKFLINEVLGICLAFDLDIWTFVLLPQQAESGTPAERRDRAWAEAQLAWQLIAELKGLLDHSIERKLSPEELTRAARLIRTAGPV